MPKATPPPNARPVMVYARKDNGPRLYIGAVLSPLDETADQLRDRVLSAPIGEWFDLVDISVNIPRG